MVSGLGFRGQAGVDTSDRYPELQGSFHSRGILFVGS